MMKIFRFIDFDFNGFCTKIMNVFDLAIEICSVYYYFIEVCNIKMHKWKSNEHTFSFTSRISAENPLHIFENSTS